MRLLASRSLNRRWINSIVVGAVAGLLVGGGMVVGVLGVLSWWGLAPSLTLPTTQLHAAATHGSDTFIVASGAMEENLEGVFFLDTLSGDLTCTVFNPRVSAFNSLFTRNIFDDMELGEEKRPKFLMVTGHVSYGTKTVSNTNHPGAGIAYIVEANSGRFAAYGVPWNSLRFLNGQPQQGVLILLQTGNVRTADVRDE